jgi:branched-chain amino acid transport system substrate-binding protein
MEDQNQMADRIDALSDSKLDRSRFLGAAAGAIAVAAGLGRFASGAAAAPKTAVALAKQKTILIGGAYPLSGVFAPDGEQMRNGPQLAIDIINSNGGVNGKKLGLVAVDTDIFTPTGVTTALNNLISKNVDAILCGFFIAQPPAWDVIPPYGCPYVNGNATFDSTKITASNPSKYYMMFQTIPSDIYYGPALPTALNYLALKAGWTPSNHSVFIIEGAAPFEQITTQHYITSFGQTKRWSVDHVEQIPQSIQDWGPVLGKIQQMKPGVIAITHTAVPDVAAFMKQFGASPTNSLVFIQVAPGVPEFRQLTGTAGDGVLWSTLAAPLPGPAGKAFAAAYKKKFHKPAGFGYAGIDYDHISILAAAWKAVGDTRNFKKVCKYIRTHRFYGLCGGYDLNNQYQAGLAYPIQTRNPRQGNPTQFFQIQNGAQKVVWPPPFIEAKYKKPSWVK